MTSMLRNRPFVVRAMFVIPLLDILMLSDSWIDDLFHFTKIFVGRKRLEWQNVNFFHTGSTGAWREGGVFIPSACAPCALCAPCVMFSHTGRTGGTENAGEPKISLPPLRRGHFLRKGSPVPCVFCAG